MYYFFLGSEKSSCQLMFSIEQGRLRFNQGCSYYCRGGAQIGEGGGLSPPGPLTLTTD